MNEDSKYALKYHEETKHSELSIRSSAHYLDWDNKPNAFKFYSKIPSMALPVDFPTPDQNVRGRCTSHLCWTYTPFRPSQCRTLLLPSSHGPVPARIPVDRPANPKPVVLFIGQDFERKGLDVAINAIAQVPDAILRVIGKDSISSYKSQAEKLGIANRVEFLGARDDVPAQLAAADALVLPSRQEPFGMVVAEALLMGVPPIVSTNAGASEIVFNGVDGRVVAGEGASDWAEAIGDVIANREKYRAEALLRRDELSYDSHLRKLMDVYDRIVAERVS